MNITKKLPRKLPDGQLVPKTLIKFPLIPPLLSNDEIISDFKEEVDHFNTIFCSQHTSLLKNLRSLNINKAHCHYDISIRMLKISDSALAKPLTIIFRN